MTQGIKPEQDGTARGIGGFELSDLLALYFNEKSKNFIATAKLWETDPEKYDASEAMIGKYYGMGDAYKLAAKDVKCFCG